MKEIDKTKQNLRIDKIDDSQRKELFNKFKEAGGQVLSEKETKRSLVIDREKQKQHQQKIDQHYSNKRIPKINGKSPKNTKIAYKTDFIPASRTASIFERFRIRMRLRLYGITGFNTYFFKKTFFLKFSNDYKPSLIEIQLIFLALFKRDPNMGNRIINSLDRISPLYYELIEKSGEMYNPFLLDQIVEGNLNFPDVPQPLFELRESLTELFRPLFILKPFENSILNSFEKSIDISNSYSEGKKDKNIRKKDLRNSLFIIFNKLYPRLHTLFCQYHNILFTESDSRIEDILSILQSEKPGNRVRKSDYRITPPDQVIDKNQKPEAEETSEKFHVSDSVKEGLKIMYSLDNKTLRTIYDKKNNFEHLSDNDKVLLAYMLFLEFEKEYSFILTTNQIKYNIDFSIDEKMDYKLRLQDIFNQLNKCRDAFAAYYDTYLEFMKVFKQKPLNNNQYIAYSKRLDEIVNKKKQYGSMARMAIKAFMDNLSSELKALIDDMNGLQKFISNPQDILEFSYELEGDKKLKDKKVFEAVEIIFNYASALSYRISPDGDLSGKLEFEENEKQAVIKSDNIDETKTDNVKNSIFDELDDII
jgi:hypothetical protein